MRFCTHCGSPLAGARFCSGCGTPARVDDNHVAPAPRPRREGAVPEPDARSTETAAERVEDLVALTAPTLNGHHPDGAASPAASSATNRGTAPMGGVSLEGADMPPPGPFRPSATLPEAPVRAVPSTGLRFGQLSSEHTMAAVKDGLVGLVGVLVVAFVLVAIIAGLVAPGGHHGSPADWFRAAVLLLGLGLHSAVELRASDVTADGPAAAAVTVALTVTPLLVSFVVLLVGSLVGRHGEKKSGSGSLHYCVNRAALSG